MKHLQCKKKNNEAKGWLYFSIAMMIALVITICTSLIQNNSYNAVQWSDTEQVEQNNEEDEYYNPNFTREQVKKGYEFAKVVKQAVKNKDIVSFSNYIKYPVSIEIDSKEVIIKNKESFIALDTDKIFTDDFIESVCSDNIFINYRGFMLGNGEIWFTYFNGNDEPKINAINIIDYS